jgi:GTPase SAR1 family protein
LHVSGADGILFCIDVTDPISLHDLQTRWVPMVQRMAPDMPRHRQIVVGLRTDLKKQINEISSRAGEKFAAYLGMPYIEASALGNVNIKETFALLMTNM